MDGWQMGPVGYTLYDKSRCRTLNTLLLTVFSLLLFHDWKKLAAIKKIATPVLGLSMSSYDLTKFHEEINNAAQK
jgi:hypothetical protein